jgi:hypothetical protein
MIESIQGLIVGGVYFHRLMRHAFYLFAIIRVIRGQPPADGRDYLPER